MSLVNAILPAADSRLPSAVGAHRGRDGDENRCKPEDHRQAVTWLGP